MDYTLYVSGAANFGICSLIILKIYQVCPHTKTKFKILQNGKVPTLQENSNSFPWMKVNNHVAALFAASFWSAGNT